MVAPWREIDVCCSQIGFMAGEVRVVDVWDGDCGCAHAYDGEAEAETEDGDGVHFGEWYEGSCSKSLKKRVEKILNLDEYETDCVRSLILLRKGKPTLVFISS